MYMHMPTSFVIRETQVKNTMRHQVTDAGLSKGKATQQLRLAGLL